MRRKRYDFTMTLRTTFLAHPNQVGREHDKLAKEVIGAIDKALGGKFRYVRDCKTGRFRKL